MFRHDKYLAHGTLVNPGHDKRLVYFTNRRILVLNIHKLDDTKLEYNIPFDRVIQSKNEDAGVVVRFKIRAVQIFGGGGRSSTSISLFSRDAQVAEVSVSLKQFF